MQIACLGWGSLIWNPGDLPLSSGWYSDGPQLPIEFARESRDGRMTLVLVDGFRKSPSLWALLTTDDIENAKSALAQREGVSQGNVKYSIGYWDSKSGNSHGKCAEAISNWAIAKGLDGVVWTNLKCGFQPPKDVVPEISSVIEHLNSLAPDKKTVAEEYIRNGPAQVRTEYRDAIETELGWFHQTKVDD